MKNFFMSDESDVFESRIWTKGVRILITDARKLQGQPKFHIFGLNYFSAMSFTENALNVVFQSS
jgi:hypothetical protein